MDQFVIKKRTIRCLLVLVLLLRRAVQNVNSRRPDTSGASVTDFFCARSQNHQYTSDGTHRQSIDSHFGQRSDYQAVGSVTAVATIIKIR